MKIKYLFIILLFIPFLTGCDQTDDVSGIFLGKTWKLTNILKDKTTIELIEYWSGNHEDRNASLKLKDEAGMYILVFKGIEEKGIITGDVDGYVTSTAVSCTWSANGKNNNFSFSTQSVNDKDILGKAFQRAMNSAYKYEADYYNLRIYFQEGAVKGYMLFHRLD